MADAVSASPLPRARRRDTVVVTEVLGGDALADRLAASGFWPGAEVAVLGAAPLGDPLLVALHGYRVALRRGEAERVLVRPAAATNDSGGAPA